MPLARRLPKRGFKNIFAKQYTEVRIDRLAKRFSAGEVVDAAELKARGVISKVAKDGIKVLGNGELAYALTVRAAKFTRSAAEKIAAAGGVAEEV
jgi:large subunit ribosomal protein L15